MKFSDSKSVEDVQKKYPIYNRFENFVPNHRVELPQLYQDDIQFALSKQADVESEMFYREYLIAPFMSEAWKRHRDLKLWVNRRLVYKDELTGEPDYFLANKSKGTTTNQVGNPLLAVAEAKQEKFTEGWGQCLAAMIACQKINADENITIYGMVATSELWQFAKLHGDTFTRNIRAYTIHMPEQLFGALDYMFGEYEKHV